MVIALTVSTELPELLTVSIAVADEPTGTFPNARVPLSPMTRVGAAVGVGVVGVLALPPPHAADPNKIEKATTRTCFTTRPVVRLLRVLAPRSLERAAHSDGVRAPHLIIATVESLDHSTAADPSASVGRNAAPESHGFGQHRVSVPFHRSRTQHRCKDLSFND